ncbi:DUF2442 domain-containing protein [Phorcysia thermohydrogeniphila]|uniref:Uncharacterized protein DUF2442 n=1 Tax=Phorcysia thermohydrogeniphila TaxID=936138 RepID=A0A4R1GH32_9BACT|nr:DUF2442 domain-containing protein [Phorcysia thermohydrogeniphila]TCK06303.1 uncharacterized protein DUF2442 [Phorcysia thermohydrogeniphila]
MARKIGDIGVKNIRFTDDKIYFELRDGREIGVPLDWFPRLKEASPEERNNYYLTANGTGIHWESIDEDISIKYLLREEFLLHDSLVEKA